MNSEEIGTILSEEKNGLKYFIVYNKNGKPFWATEGYKEASLIKFEKDWFVIKADGRYLGFSNNEYSGFQDVYYRELMDLDEIAEYDTDNSPKTTSDLDLLNYRNVSVNDISKSVEDFKSEVIEQTDEMKKEMEETLVQTEQKILNHKKLIEHYRMKAEHFEDVNKKFISRIKKLEKENQELKDNLIMDSSWDKKSDETTKELILKKNNIIEEQKNELKRKQKAINFLIFGNIVMIIAFVVFFVKVIH